jgi:VWFA-related protein
VRDQVADFISRLGPRDLVAVLYPLTPVAAATFSRNHDGTAAAIRNFMGRKYDYTPRNAYEDRYQGQPPEIQERMRNDATLVALEQACIFLGTLREGRKTLLFVSEGVSGTLPQGVNVRGAVIQPGPTPSQSQSFFASTQILSQMQQVFAAANRANTSIYALDPRGLAVSEYDISDKVGFETDRAVLQESMDTLKVLADQTDGRAIVNRNDAMPELQRMLRELSAYYLLGYTSTVAPRDGKFHQIQVRVKRRDLEVRARKGYWAYSAEEVEKASAPVKAGPPREVAAALEALAEVVEPGARRSLNLWVGARRGPNEKAIVTFVWEAAGAAEPGDAIDRVSDCAFHLGRVLHNGRSPATPVSASRRRRRSRRPPAPCRCAPCRRTPAAIGSTRKKPPTTCPISRRRARRCRRRSSSARARRARFRTCGLPHRPRRQRAASSSDRSGFCCGSTPTGRAGLCLRWRCAC